MPNRPDRQPPGQADGREEGAAGDGPFARRVYSRRFQATAAEVRQTLDLVSLVLSGFGLAPGDRRSIELVLAEVLNNVVEHAYADRKDGLVCLRVRPWQGGVAVLVVDAGRALPGGRLPCGRTADPALGRMNQPEGGFGWFVIRQFTQGVRYRRSRHRNHMRLLFAPETVTAGTPPAPAGHWKSR